MKKTLYLFIFLCCSPLFSQKADLTSAIIALDNKNDLQSAKKWIDVATNKIESGSVLKPKILSKYYHYRGLIYLKSFQEVNDSTLSSFDFLDIASESFLKDVSLESNFIKKSITQLNVCAYLYQDGAYKDYEKHAYSDALNKFTKAIMINSSEGIQKTDTFNMYNAALMAYQAEDYQESLVWSKKLILANSKDERFHLRLIRAYGEIGELDLQLEAIKFARLQIPNSKDIIFEEVNYYLATGNNTLLLKSLDEAVSSDSENPILHLVLGNTYNQLGDFGKAKYSFEQAISLNPSYFDAYNNLASIYLDQTIDLIEKKNALGYRETTKFEDYKKQINALYSQALPHLESCLELDSTNLAIISVLKEIYYKLGDSKKSLEMKKREDVIKE